MTTIQIVKNSDRCHCSINGSPIRTFLYSGYREAKESNREDHAIADAKIECFNQLAAFQAENEKAVINTEIITK